MQPTNPTHDLWVEKYRPQTIDNYVFHDQKQREIVEQWITSQSIPHIILAGVQGSGKTTLAQIIIKALKNVDDTDVLTLNASDDRGIDTFRETVKDFADSLPMGDFKVIHLEEADQLTPAAQSALKRFMEENSDIVRFIITCNNVNKLNAPIRSRCQEFFFKASDIVDVTEYACNVLVAEGVNFTLEQLDEYVKSGYPDIRKVINALQQNTVGGVLGDLTSKGSSRDYVDRLLAAIEADDWQLARTVVCSSISSDEWDQMYRTLYENIRKAPKFSKQKSWEAAIVIIAEYLYKHAIVADPEINAAAMFISLGNV